MRKVSPGFNEKDRKDEQRRRNSSEFYETSVFLLSLWQGWNSPNIADWGLVHCVIIGCESAGSKGCGLCFEGKRAPKSHRWSLKWAQISKCSTHFLFRPRWICFKISQGSADIMSFPLFLLFLKSHNNLNNTNKMISIIDTKTCNLNAAYTLDICLTSWALTTEFKFWTFSGDRNGYSWHTPSAQEALIMCWNAPELLLAGLCLESLCSLL